MKTILEHIDTVRSKPPAVRRQVAFGVAGGVSAFVALVWFVGSLATGAFVIQNASFASIAKPAPVATTSPDGVSGLAGAAAALDEANAPAHINIVDTTPAPRETQMNQTVIPF